MFIPKKIFQELVKSRDEWRAIAEKTTNDNFEVLQLSHSIHNTNEQLLAELKDLQETNTELLEELKNQTNAKHELVSQIFAEINEILDGTSSYWVVKSALAKLAQRYEVNNND